ncbi:hypothetical protein GH733_013569, partial [Mirounga leonina]
MASLCMVVLERVKQSLENVNIRSLEVAPGKYRTLLYDISHMWTAINQRLIVNLFIAVANYQTWLKSPRISSSNRILFSLGITRFLMLGLFLFNIIYFFISPNVERLLLACGLISAFTTLPYVVLRQTSCFPEFVPGRNGTGCDINKSVLSLVISLVLCSFLQFFINVTSASLLIHSLRTHIQKMQKNATIFWNPQTEAHVGAMKLLIYFLILYIPIQLLLCYIISLLLGWIWEPDPSA